MESWGRSGLQRPTLSCSQSAMRATSTLVPCCWKPRRKTDGPLQENMAAFMAGNRHRCSHHSHKFEDRGCGLGMDGARFPNCRYCEPFSWMKWRSPHSQLPHRRLQLPTNWNDDAQPWRPRDRYRSCASGFHPVGGWGAGIPECAKHQPQPPPSQSEGVGICRHGDGRGRLDGSDYGWQNCHVV